MCKEEKRYQIIHCCDSLKRNMEKSKNRAWGVNLRIKENDIFVVCNDCWADRIEALSEDYSKDE